MASTKYRPLFVRLTPDQIRELDAAVKRREDRPHEGTISRTTLIRIAIDRWLKEDARPRAKGAAA
jgi:hypothetical protein